MEIMNAEDVDKPLCFSPSTKHHDSSLLVSCNWQISNNKQLIDAITTASMQCAPTRINCEDVASVDTCIALQPIDSGIDSNTEPCILNIEVSNCQKIARIAIVSEGSILEIFKQFGEYETTIIAEFIDEYEENIVFLGETMIHPPTTEVSIKFIRTKNKGPPLWVYGIKLFLTESTKEAKPSAFDYDIIWTFLSNTSNGKISQKSEMAKKIFELYGKQEITRNYKDKLLETHASSSKYDECINESGRSNKKEFSNCGDNCEQSNVTECRKEVKRDSETECEEIYKRADADIKTCIDNTESLKKAKFDTFNYKDFIQTFLSNVSNDKVSQESDTTKMFELYDKFDNSKITNNEQFYQKILTTLSSDSDLFKDKNKILQENRKDENCKVEDKTSEFFKCKNRNIRRNSDEDCINHDYKKSDVDIKIYIDNKFHDMEKRLMERINEMEANTNQKLNAILERLETQLHLQ